MQVMQLLNGGLDLAPIALFLNRFTLGAFFILARFRFFYDPSKPGASRTFGEGYRASQRWFNQARRDSLTNKMKHCGFCRLPLVWAWAAALIEVGGGIMLVLGILPVLAALGLLVLTLFATRCTWRTKVFEQNPVDTIDCAACYLWRVEGLYIMMALVVILAGPGAWTLS